MTEKGCLAFLLWQCFKKRAISPPAPQPVKRSGSFSGSMAAGASKRWLFMRGVTRQVWKSAASAAPMPCGGGCRHVSCSPAKVSSPSPRAAHTRQGRGRARRQ